MTAPTIGRVVYYRPSSLEVSSQNILQLDVTAPFRADIVFVNVDGTVNLAVNDHAGQPLTRTAVPFSETQQDCNEDGSVLAHAHWMPYQIAQAAKAEAPVAPVAADPLPVIDPPAPV